MKKMGGVCGWARPRFLRSPGNGHDDPIPCDADDCSPVEVRKNAEHAGLIERSGEDILLRLGLKHVRDEPFPDAAKLVFGNDRRVVQVKELSADKSAQTGGFEVVVDMLVDHYTISPDETDYLIAVLGDQAERLRLHHLTIEVRCDFAGRPVFDEQRRVPARGA